MEFGFASYGFGLLAGILSTLSPCVLPIIPILLGSAANAHPRSPLALAGGLALSYAIIGTALAWAGSTLGVDASIFRGVGAAILGLLGIVLMSTSLQQRFTSATSGIGDAGNNLISRMRVDGLCSSLDDRHLARNPNRSVTSFPTRRRVVIFGEEFDFGNIPTS